MNTAFSAHVGPFLLLVQANVASEHDDQFNSWYYHHAPKLLEIPGWQLAMRYVSVYGDKKYLALYIVESIDAIRKVVAPKEASYIDPRAFKERKLFDAIPGKTNLVGNVYEQISGATLGNPFLSQDQYISVVMADVNDSAKEDEWNAWYDHSHVPHLTQVPGYLSGARFRIKQVPGHTPSRPMGPKYLALYEWEGEHCVTQLANRDTLIPEAKAELAQWDQYGAPLAENTWFGVYKPIARHNSFR